MTTPRIGLVVHPRRDVSAVIARVAAWTAGHGVELAAATEDVAQLDVTGVTPLSPQELAESCDGGRTRLPPPLAGSRRNDVVLARVPGAGMVEATLSVAGQPYGHYRCDALIMASPMGSTAYSYAAGGPVVSPSVAGVLVTPSAPVSGIARSLVLGPAETLTLELTAGHPAVELDGVLSGGLGPGTVLEVSLRPDAGRLVRIEGSRAAARSRVKLSLVDLPVLPHELAELLPDDVRRRLDAAEES